MNNTGEVTEVVKNVIKSVDKKGITHYCDAITGKYVRPTGEYTKHLTNILNEDSTNQSLKAVKNINKLTPKSLNLSTTNLKMHGSNWGTYALITAGITTASIAGIAFYKKCKRKKLEKAREKELNQLGFEFIDNSNSET